MSMKTLTLTHDAGFFSCCSKRLEGIVWFFNTYKTLPDRVDSSRQFSLYTSEGVADPASLYFKEIDTSITYQRPIAFYNDMQFLSYKRLDFTGLTPFVTRYFSPNDEVLQVVDGYEKKYHIDYEHTCVVFYRGNDKATEMTIASHELFLAKARMVRKERPDMMFLLQTDEPEFMKAFLSEFPDSISIEETPPSDNKQSFFAADVPVEKRVWHGTHFFAAILTISKCNMIITHSGNGALWAMLYRGNTENVYQCIGTTWDSGDSFKALWYRLKPYFKKLFKRHSYWIVTSS